MTAKKKTATRRKTAAPPLPPPRARLRLDLAGEVCEAAARPHLRRPPDLARLFETQLASEPYETMAVVALDARNRALSWWVAFRGVHARMAVSPAPILTFALLQGAASIAIAHNHPSGDPTPSMEDRAFTSRLAEACQLVGLRLLDHLVIGAPGRFHSIRQSGSW